MKNFMAKIWVPTLLVMLAAVQSFGIDAHRAARIFGLADTLVLTRLDDTTDVSDPAIDSLHSLDSLRPENLQTDSTATDSVQADTIILSARDTIQVPEDLKESDTFFYKYYIAVKDSATRAQVPANIQRFCEGNHL